MPNDVVRLTSRQKAEISKRVADKHGQLTPALIVTESNPSNSEGIAREFAPLIWGKSNEEAAWLWREDRARVILRECEPELIELGVVRIEAPYYIHDPTKPSGKQGYVPLMSVKSHDEVAADTMREEVNRAVSSMERAYKIAVALGFNDEAGMLYGALAVMGRAPQGIPVETANPGDSATTSPSS